MVGLGTVRTESGTLLSLCTGNTVANYALYFIFRSRYANAKAVMSMTVFLPVFGTTLCYMAVTAAQLFYTMDFTRTARHNRVT